MSGVVWLFGILLFVWLGIIAGLWLVLEVILNITLPIAGWWGTLLTGALKIGASIILAIAWLWLWKRIEYVYFWRTVKKAANENT
jgi:hypothetical protein